MDHKQHSVSEKHVFTKKDPQDPSAKREDQSLLHRVYSIEDRIPAVEIKSDTEQVMLTTIHRTYQLVVFLHFALVLVFVSSLAYYRFLHHLSFTLLSQQISLPLGYGIAGTLTLACSISLFSASTTATRPSDRSPAMRLLAAAFVGISILLAAFLLMSLKPEASATETPANTAQDSQEEASGNTAVEEEAETESVETGLVETTLLPRGTASPEGFIPPDPKLRLLVAEKGATPDVLLPASRAYRATLVLLIVQQFFVFVFLLTFSLGALRTVNKYHHIFSHFHGTNLLASISLFWFFSMLLLSIF